MCWYCGVVCRTTSTMYCGTPFGACALLPHALRDLLIHERYRPGWPTAYLYPHPRRGGLHLARNVCIQMSLIPLGACGDLCRHPRMNVFSRCTDPPRTCDLVEARPFVPDFNGGNAPDDNPPEPESGQAGAHPSLTFPTSFAYPSAKTKYIHT